MTDLVNEADIESCRRRSSRHKFERKPLCLGATQAHSGPRCRHITGAVAIFSDVLFSSPNQPPGQWLGLQLSVGVGATLEVGATGELVLREQGQYHPRFESL